jgi:hypothetical protein
MTSAAASQQVSKEGKTDLHRPVQLLKIESLCQARISAHGRNTVLPGKEGDRNGQLEPSSDDT